MLSTVQQTAPQQRAPERVRRAVPNDIPALMDLVDASMRGLATSGYTLRQVESALLYLTQVDPRLITDGTYYVAEVGAQIVGGAGWTRRHPAHGVVGHEQALRYELWLASIEAAAHIRAVYVHPAWARMGVGRRLVSMCERAAQHAGYSEIALLASVGGVPLYRACGYQAERHFDFTLPDGTCVPTVPMRKWVG